MSSFLEFHLIQNFAPSNLNRDDTGAPKDALFGGHRRARVSSQCFKRAVRLAMREYKLLPPEYLECLGVRTKKLKALLLERLDGRDVEEASAKIDIALAAAGLKIKDDSKTEYLLFLGENEIAAFAKLVNQHWDALLPGGDKKGKKDAKASLPSDIVKQAKSLMNGGKAVDVALFGRMLADLPEANQDAACQVAHAISTHRVEREFDYFTAVDDKGAEDETGAGMIGQVEFNSATFYRYAVLDVQKLFANLQKDKELTLAAVAAFTEALVRAIPTGKQNSFAAHNAPEFVGISLRHAPLSLANAFEKPVTPRMDRALSTQSVEKLSTYDKKLSAVYGNDHDRWVALDLTEGGVWPGEKVANLKELADRACELAASILGD
jgi:CRISPR system Cascade subunit CasC